MNDFERACKRIGITAIPANEDINPFMSSYYDLEGLCYLLISIFAAFFSGIFRYASEGCGKVFDWAIANANKR